MDFEYFYATRHPARGMAEDLLVLSADGKGIVMPRRATRRDRHHGSPRPPQDRALSRSDAERTSGWPRSGLSMTPSLCGARRPTSSPESNTSAISAPPGRSPPTSGSPRASSRRQRPLSSASLKRHSDATPNTARWIALVDGANYQIQRIKAEAKARGVRDDQPRLRARPRIPLERSSTASTAKATRPPRTGCTATQPECSKDTPQRSPARSAAKRPTPALTPPAANPPRTPPPTSPTEPATSTTEPHSPTAGRSPPAITESACRHLVKDRMDITGARWGLTGAEAVLKTTRSESKRRLPRILALPPQPRTTPRPRNARPQPRHPADRLTPFRRAAPLSDAPVARVRRIAGPASGLRASTVTAAFIRRSRTQAPTTGLRTRRSSPYQKPARSPARFRIRGTPARTTVRTGRRDLPLKGVIPYVAGVLGRGDPCFHRAATTAGRRYRPSDQRPAFRTGRRLCGGTRGSAGSGTAVGRSRPRFAARAGRSPRRVRRSLQARPPRPSQRHRMLSPLTSNPACPRSTTYVTVFCRAQPVSRAWARPGDARLSAATDAAGCGLRGCRSRGAGPSAELELVARFCVTVRRPQSRYTSY